MRGRLGLAPVARWVVAALIAGSVAWVAIAVDGDRYAGCTTDAECAAVDGAELPLMRWDAERER